MSTDHRIDNPYRGRKVALATKHQKERVLGPVLYNGVGLEVHVPSDLDTDRLGTFTGEVDRTGTPREVAVRKARWGMSVSGLPFGMASEGSFGPHPQLVFAPMDHEVLVFVDDERGFELVEQVVSSQTNFAHRATKTVEQIEDFLMQVQFPSHGLIVRPNSGLRPGFLFKGITRADVLKAAVEKCASVSDDGLAHVETDMRAHMNPTRQQVLYELALALTRRLAALCPLCHTPGWGLVEVVKGLPCEWCGGETEWVMSEIYGCPLCQYREEYPRRDGLRSAPPGQCPWCNP
ncbi:MAG: hypothetical protein C7B46_17655 [Sulfobacillus benefaciens]|uniref:DUF6671 domain-containing protein n=1 Tax=Sulfobacillus benefaciens TaxID=453960 RepID=A0A2T2X884_9FIRM|nr:MAG: hypothetical protein C7B46_17655 [Sulfobacillus benefaciens]